MKDRLDLIMDKLYETMLVYFADAEDDELIPIGLFLIETLGDFNDFPDGVADVCLPAGHVRERARLAREDLLRS